MYRDRDPPDPDDELQAARQEAARLRAENERLRALLGLAPPAATAEAPVQYALFAGPALPPVDASSPLSDRVAVYRSLFRGRDDVYAVHWSSVRSGKAGFFARARMELLAKIFDGRFA